MKDDLKGDLGQKKAGEGGYKIPPIPPVYIYTEILKSTSKTLGGVGGIGGSWWV